MRPSYRWHVTRLVRHLVIGIALVTLSACIGATPRDEFNAEVRARGGGLTTDVLDEALTVVAGEFGVTDWRTLEVLALTVLPGNRTVSASVRDPRTPDFVDTVVVKDGDVLSVTPTRDADELPLDELVVVLGTVALDPLETLTATALAAFDEPDGYIESLSLSRVAGEALIRIDVESARRTATVIFDGAGNLVEIDR